MDEIAGKDSHRRSRFDLRTILETSRLLTESQDIDFILNNLLLITMGKLTVSNALVLQYEPDKDRYVITKSKGRAALPEDETFGTEFFEEALNGSITTRDITARPELISNNRCTLFNLQTADSHIGFLCLGSKKGGDAFTKRELNFVEGIAAVSSAAVANAQTLSRLKQTNRRLDRKNYELNTLFDLSKEFNLLLERDEIIRIFKFALMGRMLVQKFFFLIKQDGERNLAAASNIKGELNTSEAEILFAETADVEVVDNTLADRIPFLKNNEIEALISLYFQNEKKAVVGVGKRGGQKAYSKADFNFLQSLGNLALLAVQKNLLLQDRIEKERLEEELDIAAGIQQGLLPDPLPASPALDIAATNISSRQVGGDYFDVFEAPGGRMLFAVGDVTGKGTPAALLMANLQSMIHLLLSLDLSLAEATARMNDMLYRNTPQNKFVTFFWGLFEPESSKFTFVNAGHNPPILFKQSGDEPNDLEEGGLLLGAMPASNNYEQKEMYLASGDLLIFYTDGVTEALNESKKEEYGPERLRECVQKHKEKSAQQIMDAVIDDVQAWSNNIQYDDVTLMVLKVK